MRRTRLVLVLLVVVLAAGAACSRDEPRASGVVERWLQAVSDQGRAGLRDDARERAAGYADPTAAAEVIPDDPEEGERHFSDLEVGRATEGRLGARVPFRVTQRLDGGDTAEVRGTAVLARTGGEWRVTGVEPSTPSEKVPSEGGRLPARASATQWVAALLLGVAITAVSVVVIEAQPAGRSV